MKMAILKQLSNLCRQQMRLYTAVHATRTYKINRVVSLNKEEYEQIANNVELKADEWKNIRNALLKSQRITPHVVNSLIMHMCQTAKNPDAGISYYKFLQDNNYEIHTAVVLRYLKMYILKNDPVLTKAEEMDIIRCCKDIKSMSECLPDELSETYIRALSLTSQWRKALQHYRTFKSKWEINNANMYSSLIGAAFRSGDARCGWDLLNETLSLPLCKYLMSHIDYLNYCKRDKTQFNTNIEKIFSFWKKSNTIVQEVVIDEYIKVCNQFGWTATLTDIVNNKCTQCSQKLDEHIMSAKNFQTLADALMNKVIISGDVYYNSTPEEVERFKLFIEQTKPYDIVIDGLNLMYIRGQGKGAIGDLPRIVEHFARQQKKILILAREYKRKQRNFMHLKRCATIFTVDDTSADDAFVLYATLASGPNAKFVSLDRMRQHKFQLENEYLRDLFKQWQMTHQYIVSTDGEVTPVSPTNVIPQKHNNYWHIPYTKQRMFPLKQTYECYKEWACFKINREN